MIYYHLKSGIKCEVNKIDDNRYKVISYGLIHLSMIVNEEVLNKIFINEQEWQRWNDYISVSGAF